MSASSAKQHEQTYTHTDVCNDFSLSRVVIPRGSAVLFRCFFVFPGNRVCARVCVLCVTCARYSGQVSREDGDYVGFEKHAGECEPVRSRVAVSDYAHRRRNYFPDTICRQPAVAVQPGAGLVEKSGVQSFLESHSTAFEFHTARTGVLFSFISQWPTHPAKQEAQ